jgi:hypothetical protein
MRIASVVLVACFFTPAGLAGQARDPVARADIAATIGSFSSHQEDLDEYNRWAHAFFRAVSAGYYWTDHLKTEGEIAWAGTAEAYGSRPLSVPGAPLWARVYSEHYFDHVLGSLGQTYQFGRNAVFHPFVTAGVDIVREVERLERPLQTVPVDSRPPIVVPEQETVDRRVAAHPFAATGFKAYFTDRGFFRMDLKLGFREEVEHVVWKVGVGLDF